MASALRKLADKLEGKDNHAQNSNIGPHSSTTANRVDPAIDSNYGGGYDNTHTTHGGANTGPHNSSLANKIDPRVDSTQTQYSGGYGGHQTSAHTTGHSSTVHPVGGTHTQSGNIGPHSNNLMNKLDPRVDSDMDGRNNPTTHTGGYSTTHAGAGYTQSAGVGPHNSSMANKLDPRVDSDMDGRNNPSSHSGGYGTTHTGAGVGTHTQSANVGPHSNNMMNKLDPRVDSDMDGRNHPTSGVGGYGQTQNLHSGSVPHGTHAGTHTNVGHQGYTGTNVAHDDPRSTNAGPHSSNLLNKLDPRVDSDRDGRNDPSSRTGGYGQTQTGSAVGRY